MRVLVIISVLISISLLCGSVSANSSSDIGKLYRISLNYEHKQNYAQAIKTIAPVYKEHPNSYTVNLRLGWLSYLNRSFQNSQFHYEQAIKAAPNAIEPMLGLSLPLMARGQWKNVEELMYRILQKDFYNYYANIRLSIALRNNLKSDLAEKIDKKMLTILPNDVTFLNELGVNLYFQKKLSEANSVFRYVQTLDYVNPVAKRYLKLIQSKMQKESKRK